MNSKKNLKRQWLALLKDDKLYCVLCGQLIINAKDISVEHYVPKSRGGSKGLYNCFPAHKICNEIKGNLLPDEWNKTKFILIEKAIKSWKITRHERFILLNILKKEKHV